MDYEVVIGLEVHAELSTESKFLCACTTAFGGEPNTHVCPGCAGMPGTLPVLNKSAVDYAIRLGLALGCSIAERCEFDRKSYFYPDLPKAYQVTQFNSPVCKGGTLEIETQKGSKTVGITQIHMEEDAGKLVHDQGVFTLADFNRGSVPLLEIVSQPDMGSAEEAVAYLEKLREILLYLDVCDCKMQEGSLRADINMSIRKKGEKKLGVRTEMKNMNSFKAIERAIKFETQRQISTLEEGGVITRQTLRWDDDKGENTPLRSKENAQDYRYFPEPDIPALQISAEWISRIKSELPELAQQKRERYTEKYNITAANAQTLTSHKNISDLFEETLNLSGDPAETSNLIIGEILRLMNKTATSAEDLCVDSKKLAVLINFLKAGKINRSVYKEVVEAVFTENAEPEAYISGKSLFLIQDSGAVEKAVTQVLEENQKSIEDLRAGKDRAFGFLMGQVMKKLQGKGDPATVKELLNAKLK
ncbi:MAG: Asp-tRNA(Asn)/Glu-tRNA(Gln) amidotransferase subunit GatB [Oscillospiraceae bacterium]|nr:Asp-tRNA(Asn)/Glu-tRNA(Gln) amidotransferase subunit GatB [Oscillospiraceae bacterium]